MPKSTTKFNTPKSVVEIPVNLKLVKTTKDGQIILAYFHGKEDTVKGFDAPMNKLFETESELKKIFPDGGKVSAIPHGPTKSLRAFRRMSHAQNNTMLCSSKPNWYVSGDTQKTDPKPNLFALGVFVVEDPDDIDDACKIIYDGLMSVHKNFKTNTNQSYGHVEYVKSYPKFNMDTHVLPDIVPLDHIVTDRLAAGIAMNVWGPTGPMFPDIKAMTDEAVQAKMYGYWNSLEDGFADSIFSRQLATGPYSKMAVESFGYPAPDKAEVKLEQITLTKAELNFIKGKATNASNTTSSNYETLFSQFKKEAINIKRAGGDILKTFKETKKAGFKRTVTIDSPTSSKATKKLKSTK